jgi:acyl-CoA hydrolase
VGNPTARTVADSRSTVTRLTMPSDANFMGNVFGGAILSEVDRVAYITATRHSGLNCVTASFDRVDFIAPVRLGQLITLDSRVTFVGHTSMEIWVQVHAEDLPGSHLTLVGNALVTMVALGSDGLPTPVRPLELTTPEERQLFEEGRDRMEARKRSRPGTSRKNPKGEP